MKSLSLSAALLFLGLSFGTQANELDPTAVPNEIIVREDAQGNREIFKVAAETSVADAASVEAAITTWVKPENKVETLLPESELDQTSSTEAWYYWYNYGWNYRYNYYGYSYWYRPVYTYTWGYYNYYWYRWY